MATRIVCIADPSETPANTMSLVPLMFRDWWLDDLPFEGRHQTPLRQQNPLRLFDQHFGMGLNRDDLLSSFRSSNLEPSSIFRGYIRPWRQDMMRNDAGSMVVADKDKFQVILDVQQFNPKEITVKTQNNCVIVEGKHEEKQDEHGYISRHFVRRYMLPEGHEAKDVVSSLSSDGVLTITAPNKALPAPEPERVVPITQTGPSKKEQTVPVEQAKDKRIN